MPPLTQGPDLLESGRGPASRSFSGAPRAGAARRWTAILLSTVVAVLSIVFLGGNAQAAGEWYIEAQGKIEVTSYPTTTGFGVDSFGIAYTGTLVGSNIQVKIYCYDPLIGPFTIPTDPTVSAPTAGTSYEPSSETFAKTNPSTIDPTSLCADPVGSVGQTYPQALRVSSTSSSDTPRYTWVDLLGVEPDDTTCGKGTLSAVSVGVDDAGERLGVRFSWTGTTTDANVTWRLQKTPTNWANASNDSFTWNDIDGTETGYWWRGQNTNVQAGDTVRVAIFNSGTVTDCRVKATVTAGLPSRLADTSSSGGPSDYGDATDPDTSTACSGFDIVCRMRAALHWAFVPSSTTLDQWEALGTDLETKVPFVWVVGAWELTDFYLPTCDDVYGSGGTCSSYTAPSPLMTFLLSGITGTSEDVEVLPADDPILLWMRDHRTELQVAIWILLLAPFAFWIWRRLFPAVGGSQ